MSRGNCDDASGNDLFRRVNAIGCAVAKLADIIPTHGPKAAVSFEKQAVRLSGINRNDVARDDLFWDGPLDDCAVPELAVGIAPHGPKAAIGFAKEAVK